MQMWHGPNPKPKIKPIDNALNNEPLFLPLNLNRFQSNLITSRKYNPNNRKIPITNICPINPTSPINLPNESSYQPDKNQ